MAGFFFNFSEILKNSIVHLVLLEILVKTIIFTVGFFKIEFDFTKVLRRSVRAMLIFFLIGINFNGF